MGKILEIICINIFFLYKVSILNKLKCKKKIDNNLIWARLIILFESTKWCGRTLCSLI